MEFTLRKEEDIDVSPPEANLNIVRNFPLSFTVILEISDRFRFHYIIAFHKFSQRVSF